MSISSNFLYSVSKGRQLEGRGGEVYGPPRICDFNFPPVNFTFARVLLALTAAETMCHIRRLKIIETSK